MLKTLFFISTIAIFVAITAVYLAGSYLTSSHPSDIGAIPKDLPAKEVALQSKSGSVLSAWFIQGDQDKGGILLMHGVKANRLQMKRRALLLYQAGYSVLLFDFQAHGESAGERITFGYLEALDAEAAYTYLHKQLSHQSIGVIGVSLGGASALLGSVAKQANALILESVYPTLEEAIANRLHLYLGSLGSYLLPLLTVQIEPRLGFKTDELRPINALAHTSGAVFIIAGAKDKHTTLSESERLFNAAKQPKKRWIIENAGHVDMEQHQPEQYKEKVLDFFAQYL